MMIVVAPRGVWQRSYWSFNDSFPPNRQYAFAEYHNYGPVSAYRMWFKVVVAKPYENDWLWWLKR